MFSTSYLKSHSAFSWLNGCSYHAMNNNARGTLHSFSSNKPLRIQSTMEGLFLKLVSANLSAESILDWHSIIDMPEMLKGRSWRPYLKRAFNMLIVFSLLPKTNSFSVVLSSLLLSFFSILMIAPLTISETLQKIQEFILKKSKK